MTKCDVEGCTELIAYLPFTCKYCGGTFCKNHRLPENHKCGLKLKSVSAPISNTSPAMNATSIPREVPMYQNRQLEREMPRETRTTRIQRMSFSDTPFISPSNNLNGTYLIMILNAIFYILSLVIPRAYLLLNINYLVNFYQIQTLFTSLFIPEGILSLIFSEILFYMMGRAIETKFGGKFYFTLYCVTGLMTTAAIFLIQGLGYIPTLAMMNPGSFVFLSPNSGIFIGIITFFAYTIGLDSRLTFYFFFVPVNLKAKYIIIVIVALNLISGLLNLVDPATAAYSAGSLGAIAGVLAGKIMFGFIRGRMMNRWI